MSLKLYHLLLLTSLHFLHKDHLKQWKREKKKKRIKVFFFKIKKRKTKRKKKIHNRETGRKEEEVRNKNKKPNKRKEKKKRKKKTEEYVIKIEETNWLLTEADKLKSPPGNPVPLTKKNINFCLVCFFSLLSFFSFLKVDFFYFECFFSFVFFFFFLWLLVPSCSFLKKFICSISFFQKKIKKLIFFHLCFLSFLRSVLSYFTKVSSTKWTLKLSLLFFCVLVFWFVSFCVFLLPVKGMYPSFSMKSNEHPLFESASIKSEIGLSHNRSQPFKKIEEEFLLKKIFFFCPSFISFSVPFSCPFYYVLPAFFFKSFRCLFLMHSIENYCGVSSVS